MREIRFLEALHESIKGEAALIASKRLHFEREAKRLTDEAAKLQREARRLANEASKLAFDERQVHERAADVARRLTSARRSARLLSYACGDCGAMPWTRCKDDDGAYKKSVHPARRAASVNAFMGAKILLRPWRDGSADEDVLVARSMDAEASLRALGACVAMELETRRREGDGSVPPAPTIHDQLTLDYEWLEEDAFDVPPELRAGSVRDDESEWRKQAELMADEDYKSCLEEIARAWRAAKPCRPRRRSRRRS